MCNGTETLTSMGRLWGQVVEMLEGVRKLSIGGLRASAVRYRSWDKDSCFVPSTERTSTLMHFCWSIFKHSHCTANGIQIQIWRFSSAACSKDCAPLHVILKAVNAYVACSPLAGWVHSCPLGQGAVGRYAMDLPEEAAEDILNLECCLYVCPTKAGEPIANLCQLSLQANIGNFRWFLGYSTRESDMTSECFKKYRSCLDASLFDPSRPLQENGDSVVPAEHLEDAKRQSEEPLQVVSNTVLALFWEFYTSIDMELLGRLVR